MTRRLAVVVALAAVAAWPALAGAHPGHGNQVVNMSGFQYSPASISIFEGDTMVWAWVGPDTNHSITADPGQADQFDSDPAGPPGVATHAVGDSFSYTFKVPGRFTYHCKNHASMRGVIEVKQIDATAPRIGFVKLRFNRTCRRRGRRCSRPQLELFLSEDADVSGAIERRSRGRWRQALTVGQLFFPRGRNRKAVPTRVFRPGRYRLIIAARDISGNRSELQRVPFTVRRR